MNHIILVSQKADLVSNLRSVIVYVPRLVIVLRPVPTACSHHNEGMKETTLFLQDMYRPLGPSSLEGISQHL